jgi:anti-anti-sigma factor
MVQLTHRAVTLPDGYVLVELHGELDVATAATARTLLADATGRAGVGVIVDLSHVAFLDAAGLGVLVGALRRSRHLPAGLSLAAVPPSIRRLLHLTGLDRHLHEAGPPSPPPMS